MEDFVDDPHLIESDDSFMRDVALLGKGAVEAIAIGAKDELFGQERLKTGVNSFFSIRSNTKSATDPVWSLTTKTGTRPAFAFVLSIPRLRAGR